MPILPTGWRDWGMFIEGAFVATVACGLVYLFKQPVRDVEIYEPKGRVVNISTVEINKLGKDQVLFGHPYRKGEYITPEEYSRIIKSESNH